MGEAKRRAYARKAWDNHMSTGGLPASGMTPAQRELYGASQMVDAGYLDAKADAAKRRRSEAAKKAAATRRANAAARAAVS